MNMRSLLRRFGGALRDDDRLSSTTVVVPTTLEQAIGDELNVWTAAAQVRIRERLQLAADGEWASRALVAFDRDPRMFLRLHFDASLEQSTTAIALYRAVGEVCNRTGAGSLDDALAQLGISERDWLLQGGFIFDQEPKEAP
jgi:hypothetical protein